MLTNDTFGIEVAAGHEHADDLRILADTHVRRALMLERLGERARALADWDAAIPKMDASSPKRVLYQIARTGLLAKSGEHQRAVAAVELLGEALDRHPDARFNAS